MANASIARLNAAARKQRRERAFEIERLLKEGHTVAQCASLLKIDEGTVTAIMRAFNIKTQTRRRLNQRVNHTQAIERTVGEFEAASASIITLNLNPAGVDVKTLDGWVESLDKSLLTFKRLRERIKKELVSRTSGEPAHHQLLTGEVNNEQA